MHAVIFNAFSGIMSFDLCHPDGGEVADKQMISNLALYILR